MSIFRLFISLSIIYLLFGSCKKDLPALPDSLTPYQDSLFITASSYDLPLNSFGKATLSAQDEFGGDLSSLASFYVNGELLQGQVFIPQETGTYLIKGVYKDIQSAAIEIRVFPPLSKKVLLEYFTSKYCGFCPWAGYRVDSLDRYSPHVIGYAIHSLDELSMSNALDYYAYHGIDGRPVVLVNRTITRNEATWESIEELKDSIDLFMSKQPEAELAIQSSLSGDLLNVTVQSKTHREMKGDIYLTAAIVEDNLISYGQLNYFSGWSNYPTSPFFNQPDPIPEYNNHHVLRAILTPLSGQKLDTIPLPGAYGTIAQFQFSMAQIQEIQNARIIVFLHGPGVPERFATVINAQIVKAGESVDFGE